MREQRVVVVEIPTHVRLSTGDRGLPDELATRSPKNRDALYPPPMTWVRDQTRREAQSVRHVFSQFLGYHRLR